VELTERNSTTQSLINYIAVKGGLLPVVPAFANISVNLVSEL